MRNERDYEPREWPPARRVARDWVSHGLRCVITRGDFALCGYVLLPADHPNADDGYLTPNVRIHGGLTFRQKDTSGGTWFGFDTAHYGDWTETPYSVRPGRVWTVDDMVTECEELAAQFISLQQQQPPPSSSQHSASD